MRYDIVYIFAIAQYNLHSPIGLRVVVLARAAARRIEKMCLKEAKDLFVGVAVRGRCGWVAQISAVHPAVYHIPVLVKARLFSQIFARRGEHGIEQTSHFHVRFVVSGGKNELGTSNALAYLCRVFPDQSTDVQTRMAARCARHVSKRTRAKCEPTCRWNKRRTQCM